jgi:hypothetical protein
MINTNETFGKIMNDETQTRETGETTGIDNNQYIDALNQLKQNSVDRSKYDALKAENKKLLDSIVNGTEIAQPVEEKKSIEELRANYLKEDQNNLEYITNVLALREALMAEGKPDPFLPIGEQILPTDDDVTKANDVAAVLKECVDYAEGDSDVFTNELQRRLVDVKIR